jgi:hypothetical protein
LRLPEFINTLVAFHSIPVVGESLVRIIVVSLLAGLLLFSFMNAQPARMSGTLILRSQAGSVAEEVLGKFGPSLNTVDQIQLSVEGGSSKSLIENAFLESLGRQGVHTILQMAQGGGSRTLHVTVHDQAVRYVSLPSGEYRREVRTSIEANDVKRDSSIARYLGMFTKSDIDTVGFREDIGMLASSREGEKTLFDKLVGPVALIGGAFLVVYLFFTVRN